MPPDLPRLELVCFGPPTAMLDGREPPAEVVWRKHLALLIYLALSPRRRRARDYLLGVFWGERPEGKARRALNEAVHRLRGALGEDRLQSDADALVLNDAGLEVDALRFAAHATHSPDDVLPLLRGDFLEGFYVDEASAFEEWARAERERYRALAASALIAAGERRLSESRLVDAGEAARRALALAPYSEPAVRLRMLAAARARDAATALAAFKGFAERLRADLGERPSPGLAALADRIRSDSGQPPAGRDAEPEPPLVGRERAHREAFETIAQGLAGGPRTLVITGAPGMGRSRLLAECVGQAALDGAVVALARPLETDHDAAWSALRLLLRGGVTDAPGLPGARPEALAALAAVLPELADRFPPRAVADVADMATALASVFGAIAEERPVVVALDDGHWADGATLAALGSAVRQLGPACLVLIVTVAQGVGEPPRELLQFQSDVGRGLPGRSVRLDPLTADDIRALVRCCAPWCKDKTDADRLTRRLALETAGSPCFAVTLLNALTRATAFREDLVAWPPPHETFDASFPFSIPSIVRHAIAVRVSELSDDELAILRVASVIGQALDLDLVAHVAERPRAQVERTLPAFERRQLITFDGQRYAFAAPLVVEVVRAECLTRGERRRLEQRAVELLAGRGDLENRALYAELAARVEPGEKAFNLALATASEALEAGAARVARRAIAAAERASRDTRLDRTKLDELRSRLRARPDSEAV